LELLNMIDRDVLAHVSLVTVDEWLRLRFRHLSHEWLVRLP